jgi:hypothetical protein
MLRSKLLKIAAAASRYERNSIRPEHNGGRAPLSEHERAAQKLIDAVKELPEEVRELLEMTE